MFPLTDNTIRLWREDFIKFLETPKCYSQQTKRSYSYDVAEFLFSLLRGKYLIEDIEKITRQDILGHIRSLKNKGRKKTTLARKCASLRSFFRFLIVQNIITADPTEKISFPGIPKRQPVVLTTEEIEKLLSVRIGKNEWLKKRNRAILELMYSTGIKISNVVELNISDIDLANETIRIRDSNGISERMAPISACLLIPLKQYLEVRGHLPQAKEIDPNALFINHYGRRISIRYFGKILQACVREAKLSKRVSPNTLRYSFAHHLLQKGAPKDVVRKLLGLKSDTTMKRYIPPELSART